MIVGAGDCGEKIYREIRDNARLRYHVVGFLDDDRAKRGMKIHSIPVLGEIEDLEPIAKRVGADEMLIRRSVLSDIQDAVKGPEQQPSQDVARQNGTTIGGTQL